MKMSVTLFFVLINVQISFSQNSSLQKSTETIYSPEKEEIQPEFPGGTQKLNQFLADNVHYPDDARKKGKIGKVIASFILEKDGAVSNIQIIKDEIVSGASLNVIAALNNMPKWTPGTQNGIPVRVKYYLPIIFNF